MTEDEIWARIEALEDLGEFGLLTAEEESELLSWYEVIELGVEVSNNPLEEN